MRKNYWSTLSDTQAETDGNHIIIKGEVKAKSKLEVSVVDEKDGKIYFVYGGKLFEEGYLLSVPLPK